MARSNWPSDILTSKCLEEKEQPQYIFYTFFKKLQRNVKAKKTSTNVVHLSKRHVQNSLEMLSLTSYKIQLKVSNKKEHVSLVATHRNNRIRG